VLAEIAKLPPGDLLFSLPTISNDCGQAVGDVLPNLGLFQIHEDDWRQIEFVSETHKRAVEQELTDIRSIWEKERAGVGFKRVHVRKRIPEPLPGITISLEELRGYLPQTTNYEAVSFQKTPGKIPHSFAWASTFGPVVWGCTNDEGAVRVLCLSIRPSEPKRLGEALSKLTRDKRLVFVDWCRCKAIVGNGQEFQQYLEHAE
jgi:hypothetical protein